MKQESSKKGLAYRVLLFLIDRKEHKLEEAYDWLVEKIEPQIAVRAAKRTIKLIDLGGLENTVAEGKRQILRSTIVGLQHKGWVDVEWPDKEKPRGSKSHGHYDLKKCWLHLTESGVQYILKGNGVFSSISSILYSGMLAGRLQFGVEILKDPEIKAPNSILFETETQQEQEVLKEN